MNTSETNLTHFDASGNAVMVDVSEKARHLPGGHRPRHHHHERRAFAAVESGTVKKGDVLGVARIAGIMATKRTSELIPLCHPLPLTKVSVNFRLLPEPAGCGGALHRQDGGRHRRGDGGPDGRFHRPAHHLRYV